MEIACARPQGTPGATESSIPRIGISAAEAAALSVIFAMMSNAMVVSFHFTHTYTCCSFLSINQLRKMQRADEARLVNELGFDQRDIDYLLIHFLNSSVAAYQTLRTDDAAKKYIQGLIDRTKDEHPISYFDHQVPFTVEVIDGLELRVYRLVDIQYQLSPFLFDRLSEMPHFSNYAYDTNWTFEGLIYNVAVCDMGRGRSNLPLKRHVKLTKARKNCKLWFVAPDARTYS